MLVRFIGEESVAAGEKCDLTEKKTWIIDPIDGTTNFISSNPQICTILGFMVDKVSNLNLKHHKLLSLLGGAVWYCVQPCPGPALDC